MVDEAGGATVVKRERAGRDGRKGCGAVLEGGPMSVVCWVDAVSAGGDGGASCSVKKWCEWWYAPASGKEEACRRSGVSDEHLQGMRGGNEHAQIPLAQVQRLTASAARTTMRG